MSAVTLRGARAPILEKLLFCGGSMATLGILNALKILRLAPEGATLDGGPEGKVFLPVAQVPRNSEPGQVLQVFVYRDEDGDLVATSRIPLVQRGDVAHLKIAGVNREGASLVWGLPKHLPLPWTEVKVEQKVQIREGQRVLAIVFLDETEQLIASTRLEEFLSDEAEEFQEGDKVNLVIADRTDMCGGQQPLLGHGARQRYLRRIAPG